MHGLPSSQFLNAWPWQLPLVHLSLEVQALPSSQMFWLGVWTQLVPLQVPLVQGPVLPHALPAETALCVHALFMHRSAVQALPSSVHGALLASCVQPPTLSQESIVQSLPSSQLLSPVPTHLPPTHASLSVHLLPSSQTSWLPLWLQP